MQVFYCKKTVKLYQRPAIIGAEHSPAFCETSKPSWSLVLFTNTKVLPSSRQLGWFVAKIAGYVLKALNAR
jgi:hypothetical protein